MNMLISAPLLVTLAMLLHLINCRFIIIIIICPAGRNTKLYKVAHRIT